MTLSQQLRQLKIHVVGGDPGVVQMFRSPGFIFARGLLDADVAVFTGGSDVSPTLYGDNKHPRTQSNEARDHYEVACYKRARDIFKVGICRGAQFLNVMNGGKLWQDVDRHATGKPHPCTYKFMEGDRPVTLFTDVTSTHHQMMLPNKSVAQIWGYAGETTFKEGGGVANQLVRCKMQPRHLNDPEIVFYSASKSLCFQPHPEYGHLPTRDLFFKCMERAFL